MSPKSKLSIMLAIAGLLIIILYLNGGSNPGTTRKTATNANSRSNKQSPVPNGHDVEHHTPVPQAHRVAKLRAMLDFIPKKPGFSCEELFTETPADRYNMTSAYHKLHKKYWDQAAPERKVRFQTEEYRALHYTVGQPFVKTVCETGFNAGRSNFYHLTASNQTVVHSFELGGDLYREPVAKWLASVFGNRFTIHLGDSTKTVPEYARQNPDFRCDFMFVDEEHVYSVARADMINFSNMANLENNFIAFDDYPPGWNDFGKAWEDSLADGTVQELMRCAYEFYKKPGRGIVIGVVVKHPNGSVR